MTDSAFTKLKDPPYGYQEYGPNIAVLNDDEFTTVDADWNEYKYCTTTNQWTKLANYVDAMGCTSDRKTNTLYTFNAQNIIQKYKVENGALILLEECRPGNQLHFEHIASIFLIEDQLHLLGHRSGLWYHAVMDNSAKTVIKGPLPIRHTKHDINFLSKAVFLQSKRSIIAYGLHARYGISMICEYSLGSNEWIVRETNSLLKKPYFSGGPAVVATSDDRYIISCGQFEVISAEYHHSIMIYDVKNGTFTESDIKGPSSGDVGNAVIMANRKRDEVLAFGFVKRCFQEPSFKNMQNLPHDLIQMAAKWFCFETFHLFWNRPRLLGFDWEHYRSVHWKIDVDDILKVLF